MWDNLLKTMLPMVKAHIPEIEKDIIRYLKNYPVNPGESGVTAMIDTDEKDRLFIVIVALNDQYHIVREAARFRFADFIKTLLKK
jgi:hypothetical protein